MAQLITGSLRRRTCCLFLGLPSKTSILRASTASQAIPPSPLLWPRSASSSAGDDGDPERPVKFSTSKAFQRAQMEDIDPERKWKFRQPKYQPLMIMGSLGVFMIYFLVLRAENETDFILEFGDYELPINYFERQRLEEAIKEERKAGHDNAVRAMRKRIRELDRMYAARRKENPNVYDPRLGAAPGALEDAGSDGKK